ncbi:MAG: signal peptide peptidase SppA [Caldisericota bacterium]|nr:signal peptide peptidase SppA [Caldisericota bacterium]
MEKNKIFGIIVFILIIFVVLFSIFKSNTPTPSVSHNLVRTGDNISLIKIEGTIGTSTLGQQGISPDNIKELLNKAKSDASRALIIQIDSPGGAVEPTQEIYNNIQQFKKETGKKVYISMRSEAASGGYYIACAGDKIIAMPTTLTGSIGVIMRLTNYQGLLEKIGLKETVIKSGTYKDIGSPTRDITEEEQKMLQEIIDETYTQFLDTVLKARNIPLDDLKNIARGQIYTGIQAQRLGLVDDLGNLQDTIEIVKKDLNIQGTPIIIIHEKKQSILSLLNFKSNIPELNLLNNLKPVKLEYIMIP